MTADKLETGGPAFPNDSGDDRDNNGMTTRTYAALHLGVPQSEHEFINKMIRERQRFELAKAAMQIMWEAYDNGYTGPNEKDSPNTEVIAEGAYQIADAMLAEQEKK